MPLALVLHILGDKLYGRLDLIKDGPGINADGDDEEHQRRKTGDLVPADRTDGLMEYRVRVFRSHGMTGRGGMCLRAVVVLLRLA